MDTTTTPPLAAASHGNTGPAARELVAFMRREIPMARVIDVQLESSADGRLTLRAPLAPNINDKGCAFGGSLVSLMTLAGWALVELALRARGEACDVYVGTSTVRYLAPLWQDFRCEARLAEGAAFGTFFTTLAERGKAGIEVACRIPGDAGDADAATLAARFIAKRRPAA